MREWIERLLLANYRRGLFRLWAVASLIWVAAAFASYGTLADIRTLISPPEVQQDARTEAALARDPGLRVWLGDRDPAVAARRQIEAFLAQALIPPVALLLIALAVTWAAKGFQSDERS